MRVGGLAADTGQGASLVSYQLGKLRGAGLVTVRRSTADARDNYYALRSPLVALWYVGE
jgi:DNA-binding transcriptional ArsR family regulator